MLKKINGQEPVAAYNRDYIKHEICQISLIYFFLSKNACESVS